MLDHQSRASLGYGFVRFSNAQEALTALEMMRGYRIENKTLLCKLSNNFSFPSPSSNLYIKPLPLGFSEYELHDMFSPFGQIFTVKVIAEAGAADSVIGFVKYTEVEMATNAFKKMNGTKPFSDGPCIQVKYAESDVQRAVRKGKNPLPRKQPSIHMTRNKLKKSLSPSSLSSITCISSESSLSPPSSSSLPTSLSPSSPPSPSSSPSPSPSPYSNSSSILSSWSSPYSSYTPYPSYSPYTSYPSYCPGSYMPQVIYVPYYSF